jgi:hypothetical protein
MVLLHTSSASDKVGFPRSTASEGWVRWVRDLQYRFDISLLLYSDFVPIQFGTKPKFHIHLMGDVLP